MTQADGRHHRRRRAQDSPAGAEGNAIDRAGSKTPEKPAVIRRVITENARTVVTHADDESRDSLQRLADVIAQYSVIEGRKTVVFFSEGFHQRNVTRELEMVEAAAAESYAVFYAFDLNRRLSNADQALVSPTTEASEIQARTEPLGSLAAETDGALIIDAASHLDTALGRIADQAQDYYLVGFTPSSAALSSRGQYPARGGAREAPGRPRQRANRLRHAEDHGADRSPPRD